MSSLDIMPNRMAHRVRPPLALQHGMRIREEREDESLAGIVEDDEDDDGIRGTGVPLELADGEEDGRDDGEDFGQDEAEEFGQDEAEDFGQADESDGGDDVRDTVASVEIECGVSLVESEVRS